MARPKNKIIETHGKVEDEQMQPTTLEQVWGGYNELSKYGTTSETEYQQRLLDMNRTDLEQHARKVGLVIVESSERLRGKLLQEFKVYFASLQKPKNTLPSPQIPSSEVAKILAEGR